MWPPRVTTESDQLSVYDKDLCRVLPLTRRESITEDGIFADVYTPADDAFTPTTPENLCFCEDPERPESCPPRGMQNIAPCQYGKHGSRTAAHFHICT